MLENTQFFDLLSLGEILVLFLLAFIIYLLSRVRNELPKRIRLRERPVDTFERYLAKNDNSGRWLVAGTKDGTSPAGPIKVIPGDIITWRNQNEASTNAVLQFPTNGLLNAFETSDDGLNFRPADPPKGEDGHVGIVPAGGALRAKVSNNLTELSYSYSAFILDPQILDGGDLSKAYAIGGSPPRIEPDII